MARKKPKPDPIPADRPAAVALEPDFSANDPGEPVPAEPAGPKPFAVKTDATAGVTLREDRRFRQVQLQFRDKPSDAVRELVREAGFRWQPTDRVWTHRIDREAGWKTRLDAERLFGQVVEQIGREQGVPQSR